MRENPHEKDHQRDWTEKMIKVFSESNIPLIVFDNIEFKQFMEESTGRIIHSAQHYRSIVIQSIWEKKKIEIIQLMKDPFYIQIDESPDRHRRKLVNIIIGPLKDSIYIKPKFLECIEVENTSAEI